MPDDFFQILDSTPTEEDLLEPTEIHYYECGLCALRPGSPVLCNDCLERRSEHSTTGRSRRPIARGLITEDEQRRYLTYLHTARDNQPFVNPESWTTEDLDREYPTRNEPRQEPWRRPSNPPPMMLSYWSPEVIVSPSPLEQRNLLSLQEEALVWRRQMYEGLAVPLPEENSPQQGSLSTAYALMETLHARGATFLTSNSEISRPPMPEPQVIAGVDLGLEGDQTVVARVRAYDIQRHRGMTANFGTPPFQRPSQDAVDLANSVKPKPYVPPTSRFEREPEVEDGPTPLKPFPETRDQINTALSPEARSYLSNGRGKESIATAASKLFGEMDLLPPSRFERLVWEK